MSADSSGRLTRVTHRQPPTEPRTLRKFHIGEACQGALPHKDRNSKASHKVHIQKAIRSSNSKIETHHSHQQTPTGTALTVHSSNYMKGMHQDRNSKAGRARNKIALETKEQGASLIGDRRVVPYCSSFCFKQKNLPARHHKMKRTAKHRPGLERKKKWHALSL